MKTLPGIWVQRFGGYDAKPGKFGYDCELSQGIYRICPVSEEASPNKHLGYVAYFRARYEGRPEGNSLVTYLGSTAYFATVLSAKRACEKHFRETGQFLATTRAEAFDKAALEHRRG